MSDDSRASTGARQRVAIVADDSEELLRLRTSLLRSILSRGHGILCLCARITDADRLTLAGMDIAVTSVSLEGGRVFALADRTGTAALRCELTAWQPHVLLGLGLRPMVMSALAARGLKRTRVVLLPTTLAAQAARKDAGFGFATRWSLRRALGRAQVLVTSNTEDEAILRRAGLIPTELAVRLLPGAGVDLDRFQPQPMPSAGQGLVFTMIARKAQYAGVDEFVEAARRIKAKSPSTRFVLATEVAAAEPAVGVDNGCVERVRVDDLDKLLAATHVFVHPAHREGFADDAAIALACGRPVITTDVAGCRETIDERVSGVLVPSRDPLALARAMTSFIERPQDLSWMGQAARRKAERCFDARDVNTAMLEILGLIERA